jgi:hypothetical protein
MDFRPLHALLAQLLEAQGPSEFIVYGLSLKSHKPVTQTHRLIFGQSKVVSETVTCSGI